MEETWGSGQNELRVRGCPETFSNGIAMFLFARIFQTMNSVSESGSDLGVLEGAKICSQIPLPPDGSSAETNQFMVCEVEFMTGAWVLNRAERVQIPNGQARYSLDTVLGNLASFHHLN